MKSDQNIGAEVLPVPSLLSDYTTCTDSDNIHVRYRARLQVYLEIGVILISSEDI